MSTTTLPLPLFDTLEHVGQQAQQPPTASLAQYPSYAKQEYAHSIAFLRSYNGSRATFNAYRREVERLLHWSWLVGNKPVKQLRRADIEAYLQFCQNPPKTWIGLKKVPRFKEEQGERLPNKAWRPFVVRVSKAAVRQGKLADVKNYVMSETALKEIFAILSSYFNFLIQEEFTEVNPVAHIRQKSKFLRKRQGKPKIRRLSELQWEYLIAMATQMAQQQPEKHERTLFILSALYAMYLRISELAASDRWTPKMSDFNRDHDGLWWFTTVGKGNKERQIAVSESMLQALKRWRLYLGLSALPSPADTSPLLPKIKGSGAISSTTFLRKIVQKCFDATMERLQKDGFSEEADTLMSATVHWLRHTGISEDVKIRPREHVRDDAGHSSSAITDRYIDIELRERHASAKNKPLKHSDDEADG